MEIPELPDGPGDSLDPGSGTRYRLRHAIPASVREHIRDSWGRDHTLSVWRGYATRLHNRLSVQPYLNVRTTRLSKDTAYVLRIDS